MLAARSAWLGNVPAGAKPADQRGPPLVIMSDCRLGSVNEVDALSGRAWPLKVFGAIAGSDRAGFQLTLASR